MSCISDQTPQISRRYRVEHEEVGDIDDGVVAVEEIELDERRVRRKSLFKTIITILIWILIAYVLFRMFVAWQSSNSGKPAQDVSEWWKKQTALFRDDPNNPNDLNDQWRRLTGRQPHTPAATGTAVIVAPAAAGVTVTAAAAPTQATLMQQATLPAATPGFSASPASVSAMNAGSAATITLPVTPTMAATAAAVNANGQTVAFAGSVKPNPYYAEGWGASPYYTPPNWNNAPAPANNIATGSGSINDTTTHTAKAIDWKNSHPCPAGDCARGLYPDDMTNYYGQKH